MRGPILSIIPESDRIESTKIWGWGSRVTLRSPLAWIPRGWDSCFECLVSIIMLLGSSGHMVSFLPLPTMSRRHDRRAYNVCLSGLLEVHKLKRMGQDRTSGQPDKTFWLQAWINPKRSQAIRGCWSASPPGHLLNADHVLEVLLSLRNTNYSLRTRIQIHIAPSGRPQFYPTNPV